MLFLGSTIGNPEPDAAREFLRAVRGALKPGDALLLGTDLVKPAEALVRAYDDPLGVTAAFNLNLLARMNREPSAGFDLKRFRHEARWRQAERRIEMHLVARRAHEVAIPGLEIAVTFHEGESIWTERACTSSSGAMSPSWRRRRVRGGTAVGGRRVAVRGDAAAGRLTGYGSSSMSNVTLRISGEIAPARSRTRTVTLCGLDGASPETSLRGS